MHNTINKNIFNNPYLLNTGTGLGLIGSHRYFSTSTVKANKFNPESLALDHINSGKPTTSLVINKILLNQNITLTDTKLKELLKVKGVELDLPIITPETKNLLSELTGKSQYKGFFGVYMFIHKKTGNKYVGSSNLLRRRLDYYFKSLEPQAIDLSYTGKFLPFLKKEGLSAFKLIIFKLDSDKFSVKDALILEQYHLLNKEFNLNTLRVVNAGSSKGESIYVYDLSCKILYYQSSSKIELKRVLKIHPETVGKYLDSKKPYLNKFLLLSFLLPDVSFSHISSIKFLEIMQKERKKLYALGTRRSISVILEIKEGNTKVTKDYWGKTLNFESLTSCIEYLKNIGLFIKRDTLTKYIKIEKEFHKFLCKYSDKNLPSNFEEVGLIIDEYKQTLIYSDIDLTKKNKKNKAVLVKSEDYKYNIKFDSITDTIKHFDSINIKLDRKTLNLRLKDGKLYKGYYFNY